MPRAFRRDAPAWRIPGAAPPRRQKPGAPRSPPWTSCTSSSQLLARQMHVQSHAPLGGNGRCSIGVHKQVESACCGARKSDTQRGTSAGVDAQGSSNSGRNVTLAVICVHENAREQSFVQHLRQRTWRMMAAICALTSFLPSVDATLVRRAVSSRGGKQCCAAHPVASSSRCTLKTQRSRGSREATEATTRTSLCKHPSSNHAASGPRAAAPQRVPQRRVVTQKARLTAGRARRPSMCASLGATRPA